jgi:hypothetical protein
VPLTGSWNAGDFTINSKNSVDLFNVVAYGADPGGTNSSAVAITTALADAVASGGTVYFPRGIFKTGQITLPILAPGHTVRILGAGKGQTFLIPAAINTQLFAAQAGTVVQSWEIGDFSAMAHASGSTGACFNLEGFDSCYIHDIEYLTNPNNTGNWATFFYLHAPIGSPCYNNRLSHINIKYQYGPTKAVYCDAHGDINQSANLNFVDHWDVEGPNSISRIFDVGDSLAFHISDCLLEGNTGTVVLVPGMLTTLERCYFEANALVPILPEAGHVWPPQWVTIRDNWFNASPTITMTGTSATDWQVLNNNQSPVFVGDVPAAVNNLQVGNNFQNGIIVNQAVVATGAALLALYPSAAVMDWVLGSARFFSIGANASTMGAYLFRQSSSDGSVSGIPMSLDTTGGAWLSEGTATDKTAKVGGTLFTQTADKVTVANVATTLFSTGVGSLTLPAGLFVAGRTIEITMSGYVSVATPASVHTLLLSLGGVTVATGVSTTTIASVLGGEWQASATITCRTIGAGGTVVGGAAMFLSDPTNPRLNVISASATGTAAANTTGTLTVDLTLNNGNATGTYTTQYAEVKVSG